jgi:flagellar basal body P-ring formation protein FlgA
MYVPIHVPSSAAGRLGLALRVCHWRGVWLTLVLVLLTGAASIARATPATPPGAASPWAQEAQHWIDQQVERHTGPGPALRPEVEVGSLDPRLRLAACNRVEPYLPQGTRLWGKSRIGLRCIDGPVRWNVFLPVTVRAWGPAWVVRQPVAPGSILAQEDAELAEIDWAESMVPVLPHAEDWVGAQSSRALMPGQVLRQGMVRARTLFAAGSQVKLVVEGEGFRMAAEGEALGAGVAGQPVRVRLPGRRVVTGIVRDAETVVIAR